MNQQQFDYLIKVATHAAAYKFAEVQRRMYGADTFVIRNTKARSAEHKRNIENAYLKRNNFTLSKMSQALTDAPDESSFIGGSPSPGTIGNPQTEGTTPPTASSPTATDPISNAIGDTSPVPLGGDVLDSSDNNSSLPPDLEQFLSEKVIELEAIVQDIARNAWNINLSQPDILRVVKETVKIMSNKVADVPIQGVVDKIDHYLEKVDKSRKSKEKEEEKQDKTSPLPGNPTLNKG